MGARTIVCALGVVLLAVAGLSAALVPSAAAQEEPVPTTTTTPVPDPAPDPAPPIKPKPAPKPKPKPRQAAAPRQQSRPASTPAATPTSTPTYRAPTTNTQRPAVARKKPVRTKPKAQAKKAPRQTPVKKRADAPEVGSSGTLGASVGLRNPAAAKTSDAMDIRSLLIVLGLAFATACFAIAVIPATHVPWRPAAIFVSERQVDLTVLGFALLMTTALLFFLARGA